MLQSEKHEYVCQFSLSILQIDTRTLEFDSAQHNLVAVENPFVYVRIGTMNEISKGRGLKKRRVRGLSSVIYFRFVIRSTPSFILPTIVTKNGVKKKFRIFFRLKLI